MSVPTSERETLTMPERGVATSSVMLIDTVSPCFRSTALRDMANPGSVVTVLVSDTAPS